MVQIFGDWFGNMVAIFVIFVIYLFMRINTKEKKTWDRLDFYFSLAIFLIVAFEVFGALFFGSPYYGPEEGFIISVLILLVTAVSGTVAGIEMRAGKKFW